MRKQQQRGQAGFTLVEVMMATGVFSVGAISVLVVLAAAGGFASKRMQDQRLAQVVLEARMEAEAFVNAHDPTAENPVPGGDDGTVGEKSSTLFSGYAYGLRFVPVDKAFPQAGYEVEVTIHYGEDLEDKNVLFLNRSSIADIEFARSITWDEERLGTSGRKGGQEK